MSEQEDSKVAVIIQYPNGDRIGGHVSEEDAQLIIEMTYKDKKTNIKENK